MRRGFKRHIWLAGLIGLVVPCLSAAQDLPTVPAPSNASAITVRAVRVSTPPRIDGKLDEEIYRTATPMTGFIQVEPNVGAVETEKTELWLLFDDDNVYVVFRCWDSHPERIVGSEMRRDGNVITNDVVTFIIDTFHDRRNGLAFNITAGGGRTDGQITNETGWNQDLNPVWTASAGRFEQGWTAESAIPFRSLRFKPGREQVWGFNARRLIRSKNEISHIVPLPPRGANAIMLVSRAATLEGIEAPVGGSRSLEIKPYAVGGLTTDRAATTPRSNDLDGDAGVDVKYGLTENLTADFTYNTDFAQVEADEQQVNLTRFSLFFPEKREFFLENQGTFAFGSTSVFGGGGGTPTLFYSRRIGLERGAAVPLLGGGRLTGRVGRFNLGVLTIQSDDVPRMGVPATNFSVARLKRDVFRRSSVGVMATHRSITQTGTGSNDAYGVDGTFAFFDDLGLNVYWARTRTTGITGDDASYRAQLDYNADRYGLQVEHLSIGDHFNPEIGFVRRDDIRRSYAYGRFSPRTRAHPVVRKLSWTASMAYIENGSGELETRDSDAEFAIEMHNSDRVSLQFNNTYEFLPQPFAIGSGVTLPTGAYEFSSGRASYTVGQQRKLSASFAVERGTFYNGHRTVFTVNQGRIELSPRFSLQPSLSINWVDVAQGSFSTTLAGSRVTYTMTPQMFASALVQYNSSNRSLAANVRLRWEYQPGSELFIVYNDQRDTASRAFPDLVNRAVIVKVNRLFRF
jgi:hypothetical protein